MLSRGSTKNTMVEECIRFQSGIEKVIKTSGTEIVFSRCPVIDKNINQYGAIRWQHNFAQTFVFPGPFSYFD